MRDGLSDRDWAVIQTLTTLRLASGAHLERLHFENLTTGSQPVVRRRVLSRLVSWGVLVTLDRRVGGVRAGSSGLVYALGPTGHRLAHTPARRRELPGERFWRHLLAVTELYVGLAEQARAGRLQLATFQGEPACWWRDAYGAWLKPDAFVLLSAPSHDDAWWVEIDRATESLPTLRRKLTAYVDFARTGQRGPAGLMPRVLVTVPTTARQQAVETMVRRLPAPAGELVAVTLDKDASLFLASELERKS
ncbi:replication-relaxation family protein [Kitasatospora sp. P5_F3]